MVRRAKAKRKQKEAEEAAAKQRTVNISAIHITLLLGAIVLIGMKYEL